MAQVKHSQKTSQKPAATFDRNFRTFLLLQQFQAKEIGARIATARREAGLTQEELASMASFSKRSLQDYEAGFTVPYRHFNEIGKLLNRPVEWFLHGTPDPEGVDDRVREVEERLEARLDEQRAMLEEALQLVRELRRAESGEDSRSAEQA